jgi:predicted ester cyclase
MENLKSNVEIVKRLYEAFNKKNEKIIDEIIANDYVDYGHQPPGRGPQGAKDDFKGFSSAFDAQFNLDEIIPIEDRVFVRWSGEGTNTGTFLGAPATNKKVKFQGMSIYRLRDGKIIETRNAVDFLSPLVQLGLVSLPGQKAA